MSWTKYRERPPSPEVSLNESKDSSLNEETHSEENISGRSLNSNRERWLEDPEPVERRPGMKQNDCVPFLVQLIHSRDQSPDVREGASSALRNVIHAFDDKKGREKHIFELLEQLRDYSEMLKMTVSTGYAPENLNKHPNSTMSSLMKLSFNENYHHTICYLGGLQTIAELIECEHAAHGSETNERDCITLRRDSGMTLASLIVGDTNNKALLCSFRDFIKVWVTQLFSPCEELRQVTASVFCNLSWRADNQSKQILREAEVVAGLMKAAMRCRKESSLKTILSALWNLSAHCAANKAQICAVEGALAFLVNMLCYESPSKGLAIAENAGGIIRNVSSHIAVREDYRAILRQKNCIRILIRHLKSPSLTVISNACGTLWNLSAWCPRDQKTLWELEAIPLLRNLANSKHKMISMGASSALRNLLTAKGANGNSSQENKARKQVPEVEDNASAISQKPVAARGHEQELSKGGCLKKNPFSDSMYRYDRGFVPIDARTSGYPSHDRSTKPRSVPTAYISTEPGKKLKFCIKLTSDYDESKENFRNPTDVPWNSPPDMPSYTRPRVCSPVEENLDEASASAEESNSSFEKPYENFINRSPTNSACDEDANDQPIDYSKKYTERNQGGPNNQNQTEISVKKEFADHEDKVDLFGDYVETDLDQPTDYSLRYAEDDTDEEEKENQEYFRRNELEDTVKTYCTEGTPYQTPFNFSTATSMSDLRVEDAKEGEVLKKFSKKMELRNKGGESAAKELQDEFDETKEIQVKEEKLLLNTDAHLAEKPVSYCVEGTPQCFSRVSSLSSLGSAVVAQNLSIETVSEEATGNDLTADNLDNQQVTVEESGEKNSPVASAEREKNEGRIVDKEGKMVTFGREDRYAEQTPLMFSRCSSLGSLSGFEQHSIRDDLSSGISDFSRMTSGVVSPSELPDSPTQTVPPSPRHKHQSSEFGRKVQHESRHSFPAPSCSKMQTAKRSVFEDEMSAFKDESTPLEFSAATSLSSLTIDDEPKFPKFRTIEKRPIVPETEECTKNCDKSSHISQLVKEDRTDDDKTDETLDSNRYSSNEQKSIIISQPSCNLRRFETSFMLDRLDSAFKRSGQGSSLRKITDRVDLVTDLDSMHVYCTEDTPDGSISNLSALSMPSIPDDNENIDHNKLLYLANQRNKSSDEDSNSSSENEILEEQIVSEKIKNKVSTQNSAQNSSLEVPLNSCNNSATSLLPEQSFKVERSTPEPSEDSVSLTEEENNKLDELIESAMPKRRLNESSSLANSEQNLERSSPAPSVGSNSFIEEEAGKLNRLIETSSAPSSPKPINTRASNSNSQQNSAIKNSFEDSVSLMEDNIKVYQLMESEMPERPFEFSSNSNSPRTSSPIAAEFYRSNPCGRSSSPTTLLQPSRKENSSPAPSEDSISLTEEENIKLDQLIESAMPKRQNTLSPSPRSSSPKIVVNKSNYNSPTRRIHSSSQSEILLRNEIDFTEDEDSRLNQLIEAGIPKKKLSVSSRSSPINVRPRPNHYSENSLPLSPQQSYKSRINRDSFNDFHHKDNIRFDHPKKRGNGPKISPSKSQESRSSKSSTHSRPSYNSNRQNFFRGDRIKPEPEDDTISLTEEDNMKLDQLIESAMPKKQTQAFQRASSGRVLDDIPANRMLPYGCSSPPSFPQNSCKTGRIKSEQNENRNSLTEEENLRLDELIESAMPKKRNSSLKSTPSKLPENISHRSNSCVRSSNSSLRRHPYGNVGKWKYYKRLSFSRILRFIRESYP